MLSPIGFEPAVVDGAYDDVVPDTGGYDTGAGGTGGRVDNAGPPPVGVEPLEDKPLTGGYEAVGPMPLDETGGIDVGPGKLLLYGACCICMRSRCGEIGALNVGL